MQEIIEDGESSDVNAVLNDERYKSFKVSICLLKMAFHLSVLRILGGYISLGCITKCH
jgi:hypothetical protein